jgi:hypothetical protein
MPPSEGSSMRNCQKSNTGFKGTGFGICLKNANNLLPKAKGAFSDFQKREQ